MILGSMKFVREHNTFNVAIILLRNSTTVFSKEIFKLGSFIQN
jgi:hypothetical protein